jgi:predicted SprT family Zn-dependent metalloprotease
MDLKALAGIAAERLAGHGLAGWTFGLSESKRRLGVCKYRQKRIEIGSYYAVHNPEAAVLDTLLHEIAHALAGPEAGHGPAWQAVAARIGATPRACDNSPDTVVQPGDWQTTCPGCNRTHHRYRRPRALSGYRCKCPAASPLVFAFVGAPDRAPPVPLTLADAATWQAICAGCGTVHHRQRRPKDAVWRCKCAHRCELTWRFVTGGSGVFTAEGT